MSATGTAVPTLDAERASRLVAWMDAAGLPGAGAPLECRFLSGGSQNEIFELRRGDLHCVMRIPPATAPPDRDRGIVREWRIIEALDGTDVPHTPALTVCTDMTVLGRTFYLMGFVDGWSPIQLRGGPWPTPFDTDVEARRGLAYELVDGIAKLSTVDWRARGLEDLGRPEDFHERQVDRWLTFLGRIQRRDIPGLEVASAWLRRSRPLDYIPGLMHGDYHLANVMYRHGAPARLAAIVDWEMGTIGDPKLDLAWVVQTWPEDTTAGEATRARGATRAGQGTTAGERTTAGTGMIGGHVDLSGMPSRSQVLARYAEVSGRQVDDIDYYLILARWKLAIVLERGYQRAGDSPALRAFGPIVLDSMRAAAELAETTDYRS